MFVLALPLNNRIRPVRRINWTNQADARLAHLHGEGVSIRMLATAFGLSRTAIAVRAGRLGLAFPTRLPVPAKAAPAPDLARDPLPAGHPISWGLITAGTSLEGCAYEIPDSQRLRRPPTKFAMKAAAETIA